MQLYDVFKVNKIDDTCVSQVNEVNFLSLCPINMQTFLNKQKKGNQI